jgi:diguanylate cyclase (GGDEF)-like protein
LNERLEEEVERARRYEQSLCLLLIDIDHFKSVNDAFGHMRGDEVLAGFVERLGAVLRGADLIFRYGGDEFLVILPNTNKESATQLAGRLLEQVRETPFGQDPPLSLTLSIGVASFPHEVDTQHDLLERTDLRLYEAKREGRDRAVAHDPPERRLRPPTELSRLVERERESAALSRFLDALPEQRRGIMVVTGPSGSGRSRFLAEVVEASRLRGFEVAALRATEALRNRPYGALREAVRTWSELPADTLPAEFAAAFENALRGRAAAGAVIAVDDLQVLDSETLELLERLFPSSTPFPLALAYSTDREGARRNVPVEAPLREAVELEALTRKGVRLWLRSLLQWEPPEQFSEWLYRETGGLPSFLWKGLSYLVERGFLEEKGGTWVFGRDYGDIALGERIGAHRRQPAHQLPLLLTSFVGRTREIRQVEEILRERRLLTITGPGGIGKTRLAVQAAAERVEDFPDGTYLISLASVASPELILPAVAEALGFTFSGRRDLKSQLLDYLREKELLLVMDNFEHLMEGAVLVREILQAAPRVRVLATSRERLSLQGESVLDLAGLKFPESADADDPERYDAVRLFLRTAQMTQVGFSLSRDQKPFVVRICQLVEGMPLAIELASSWVRMLSCEEIVEEIEQSSDFLRSSARDVPERHRSLRAVFRSSWALLTKSERQAYSHLSVFRGGFTRDAAGKVASAPLPLLHALADKSLVHRTPTGRYEVLEVLREYAQDELRRVSGASEAVRDRHCRYFAELLTGCEDDLRGRRQVDALNALAREAENIRAAWSWGISRRMTVELDASLDSLYRFHRVRSRGRELEELLRAACAQWPVEGADPGARFFRARVLTRLGDVYQTMSRPADAHAAIEESTQLLTALSAESSTHLPPERLILERATLLGVRCEQQRTAGELEEAARTAAEAQALLADIPAPGGAVGRALGQTEAGIITTLGAVRYMRSQFDQAFDAFTDGMKKFTSLGDMQGVARTACNLGSVSFMRGDFERAAEYYERYLAASEELGDRRNAAQASGNLGAVYHQRADYEKAIESYLRYLRISEELGDKRGAGVASGNLGLVHYIHDDFPRAMEYYQRKLRFSEELGDRRGIGIAKSHLGLAHDAVGEHADALACHQEHLRISEELGDRQGIAVATRNMGALHEVRGDYRKAEELYERSLEIAQDLGDKQGVALTSSSLAGLLVETGDYRRARGLIDSAREAFEAAGNQSQLAELANRLCQLGLKDGTGLEAAEEHARQAFELSSRLGLRSTKATALQNLARVAMHRMADAPDAPAEATQQVATQLQQASRILEEIGKRKELAETWLQLGVFLRRMQDSGSAEYFDKARDEFERLGLQHKVTQVERARTRSV